MRVERGGWRLVGLPRTSGSRWMSSNVRADEGDNGALAAQAAAKRERGERDAQCRRERLDMVTDEKSTARRRRLAAALGVACREQPAPVAPPASRGVRHRRRAERRARISGTGRPDPRLPGRRDSRARRGLSRDGEFPRRVVRRARATCSTRSTASRSRPRWRPRRRTRPPRRRGSKRPTTTSTAIRRSSPRRRSASRNWTTRWPRATRRGRRWRRPWPRWTRRRSIWATRGCVAPINGLVGTTLVKPGNLVGRGESHAAHHHLAARSDDSPRRRHRSRLPARHQARSDARRRRTHARAASS